MATAVKQMENASETPAMEKRIDVWIKLTEKGPDLESMVVEGIDNIPHREKIIPLFIPLTDIVYIPQEVSEYPYIMQRIYTKTHDKTVMQFPEPKVRRSISEGTPYRHVQYALHL
ncbi:MAG: hypothetical protein V1743_07710 [Nanoarchaeota archaeon]